MDVQNRNINLDALRAFAIFGVVTLHVLVHRPFNKYHINQIQHQTFQYHPFYISNDR